MPEQKSEKSYAVAVIISAVFGVVGIQHFYLGTYIHGIADILLTAGFVYFFAIDEPVPAFLLFGIDMVHTWVVTFMLLVGAYRDGKGRLVCYPGQKLKP